MNNKKTGMKFEKEFLKYLSENGWWAHFLSPNASGQQPFDIIALRGNQVYAIDCKTCATDHFPLSRVEQNQDYAFSMLTWKTDAQCGFIIEYNNDLYYVPYWLVLSYKEKHESSIKLTEGMKADASNRFELYQD